MILEMARTCAHPYRFGSCRVYVGEDEMFCWQHDPVKAHERDAVARKRNRTRKPQGLGPPSPNELQRVKRWFRNGGAQAFDEFSQR